MAFHIFHRRNFHHRFMGSLSRRFHLNRRRAGAAFLLAGLLMGGGQPARAQSAALRKQVETRRKQADELAKKGQWKAALQVIGKAREAVRDERRAPQGTRQKEPTTAHRREIEKLRAAMSPQLSQTKPDTPERKRLEAEYQQRKAAIHKKYGHVPGPRPNSAAVKTRQAQYDLLLASLDERAAEYATQGRDTQAALVFRAGALMLKVQAYGALDKQDYADQAAEKLLKSAPQDPRSYDTAGQHFQTRRQYERAARVWADGIRMVESGKARVLTRPTLRMAEIRGSYLPLFHRQAAYCYSKLGKQAEMQTALQKAHSVETETRRTK